LSNALFDAALTAGCEIVERHAHTRRLPGSMAAAGRDATIFWNYVDLRFRAPVDCQLDVRLHRGELRVALRRLDSSAPAVTAGPSIRVPSPVPATQPDRAAESCETCGMTRCFRNPSAAALPREPVTAWLVDAWWPEHDAWMQARRRPNDVLLLPLDRRTWRTGPYRWESRGFARVRSAPLLVLRRSWISRRLAAQGAARQSALLRMDAALAMIYSERIPCTALHLVVSQNLLPFLWRRGVLAGRTFDVLMTRLPLTHLHAQLDRAAQRWPDSPTLADFRADPDLVAAESEALAEAQHWITPHRAVAALAGSRAIVLDWKLPAVPRRAPGRRLVFPASTLSRKGARELREALPRSDLPLTVAGSPLEGPGFWSGTGAQPAGDDWLADAAAVVLPAWVDHQPRRLLTAIAAGIPVICTPACGLPAGDGVTIVPEGDPAALREAIAAALTSRQARTEAGANLVPLP
jgi:hypothetical protein